MEDNPLPYIVNIFPVFYLPSYLLKVLVMFRSCSLVVQMLSRQISFFLFSAFDGHPKNK